MDNIASPLLDPYDCNGENPYQIKEILPNKVWQIGYSVENNNYTRPEFREQQKHLLGMDPLSEDYKSKVMMAAKEYGDEAIQAATNDLETVKTLLSKTAFSKEELFDQVPPSRLNMMVVRLNNGELLLYAPVRIHKEAKELIYSWLESIGPVKWIVVASAPYTLFLPDVIKTYPEAKVVGPKFVDESLKGVNALENFYCHTDDENDLDRLNVELQEEGVELFNVDGDVMFNAVLCLVRNEVILECDLIYGHQDGHGVLNLNENTLKQWKPEDFDQRLFKFGSISKPNSPNGFLPNYRFWFMDPESLGASSYNLPSKDGSSSKMMAASLRKVLQKDYKVAVGVNFDIMTRDEFQGSIDSAWNWLDGKPLK